VFTYDNQNHLTLADQVDQVVAELTSSYRAWLLGAVTAVLLLAAS
jgi:hypothetical protein